MIGVEMGIIVDPRWVMALVCKKIYVTATVAREDAPRIHTTATATRCTILRVHTTATAIHTTATSACCNTGRFQTTAKMRSAPAARDPF